MCSCCGCLWFGVTAMSVLFSVCGDLVCTLSFADCEKSQPQLPSLRDDSVHITRALLVPTSTSVDLERSPWHSSIPCQFDRLRLPLQRCSLGFPRRNFCAPILLGDSAPRTEFFHRLEYLKFSSVSTFSPLCRHGGFVHDHTRELQCAGHLRNATAWDHSASAASSDWRNS